MSGITDLFGQDGSLHQVLRTGSMLTDLSTGRSGFVISESGDTSTVTDQRGGMHQFLRNGTAILIEGEPVDQTMGLPGCRFEGNGTDIDNRSGQPLDISQAAFQ